MNQHTVERFFETLIAGNRTRARAVVAEASAQGMTAERLITDLFWPTYELTDKLFREDQLSTLAHHTATRLLRVLVDQNSAKLAPATSRNRRVLACCGPTDADEMGGQMAVDLLEAAGFEVTFAGGGNAADEILGKVNESQPDVLLMFASAANDLPLIRNMIDTIREIDGCPGLQIAVGAGVFNRAEGLAEEIGADLWACSPLEMVQVLIDEPARRATADQRTVGKKVKPKARLAA